MWRCSENPAAFAVGNTFLRWLSCVHPLVVIVCPWARLTSPPTITAITPVATTIARIGARCRRSRPHESIRLQALLQGTFPHAGAGEDAAAARSSLVVLEALGSSSEDHRCLGWLGAAGDDGLRGDGASRRAAADRARREPRLSANGRL